MNKFEISISSKMENISFVEDFIENLYISFGLSSESYGIVTLSVIEAVRNAILHGNKQDSSKFVNVMTEKYDTYFKITVMDEGSGFDYSNIPDPTSSSDASQGKGRGLYLMKTFSDELIFENHGSVVTMVFYLNRVESC